VKRTASNHARPSFFEAYKFAHHFYDVGGLNDLLNGILRYHAVKLSLFFFPKNFND
jgi:hypothetical protein